MPRNFTSSKKWFIVGILSSISMVTPFASAINSPAISSINREFRNTNSLLATLSVTIYLLGYAIGPLILAPLCELYGRKKRHQHCKHMLLSFRHRLRISAQHGWTYRIAVACGNGRLGLPGKEHFQDYHDAQTAKEPHVLTSRNKTLGAAVVSEMFPANARGRAMGILTCGPLLGESNDLLHPRSCYVITLTTQPGPTLGPLVGGFVVSDMNWRWVFWVVVIIGCLHDPILFQFGATETNPRILIQRKTIALRKQLRKDDLRSCYDSILSSQKKRQIQRVCDGFVQPAKLLFLSPLVLSLSIYIAFVYGTMYLLFTTVTLVFSHTYGFNERQTGLIFLSLGAGTAIGRLVTTIWSDRDVVRLVRANNRTYVPEMRLHIILEFAFLVPLTFFWYGWSAYYKAHSMSTILSLVPFQTGIVGVVIPMTTRFLSR